MTPTPAAPTEPHKARCPRGAGLDHTRDQGVRVRVSRGLRARYGCGDLGGEGGLVIAPLSGVRMLVATKPAGFRKGMGGLAALAKEQMSADPFSGVIYVCGVKPG